MDAVCKTHGTTYMAQHEDGSATCGRCYMQQAVDLGVISGPRPRKRTRFHFCVAHAGWFAGETRNRQAECFVEGGPALAPPCAGLDRCEMRPRTDFFTREFVEDHSTATPAAMGWPNS